MGRAESRPRERQSRRLSFGLRCVAGASSLPFLSRLPRAAALALPLLAAAVLVPAGEARAQTTVTLVSNTGQTVSGNVGIVYLVAQGFRTGGKIAGYNLASVGIALGNLGFDSNTVTVTLRKSTSGLPGDVVYTFASPTLASDSINTFTAPGSVVLSANTNYFLVVQETSGAVSINATEFTAEDAGAAAGFSIANTRRWCRSPCTSWSTADSLLRLHVKGSVVANAAPTTEGNTIDVDQDGTYTFSVSDFPFEDDDTDDTLASVSINNRPAKGTMQLDGAPVPIGQAIPVADIEDGKLTYSPAAGESGTTYTNFSFRVSDGTDQSGTVVMIIDVTPSALPVVQFHVDDVTKTETEKDGTVSVRVTLSAAASVTSCAVSPIPDHAFFKQPVLQHLFGKHLLEVMHLTAQVLDLARGCLAGGIARKPLPASFQKLLRPAVVKGSRRSPPGGTARRCCPRRAGPTAQSESSPRPNIACASGAEYSAQPAQRALWLPWISVSSPFPSVTTMSQKSSVTKIPQPVP